jgi:YesN/AraC family two-component response regulator
MSDIELALENKCTTCNILFVDDESAAISLFELSLKAEIKEGKVKLLCFESGDKCVEYFQNNEVEAAVMFSDINMPGMDGFSLLDKMKVYHPHLDLYFVSAFDREDFKMKATSLGAKGFLTKPVNFGAIKAIIKGYLK